MLGTKEIRAILKRFFYIFLGLCYTNPIYPFCFSFIVYGDKNL